MCVCVCVCVCVCGDISCNIHSTRISMPQYPIKNATSFIFWGNILTRPKCIESTIYTLILTK